MTMFKYVNSVVPEAVHVTQLDAIRAQINWIIMTALEACSYCDEYRCIIMTSKCSGALQHRLILCICNWSMCYHTWTS